MPDRDRTCACGRCNCGPYRCWCCNKPRKECRFHVKDGEELRGREFKIGILDEGAFSSPAKPLTDSILNGLIEKDLQKEREKHMQLATITDKQGESTVMSLPKGSVISASLSEDGEQVDWEILDDKGNVVADSGKEQDEDEELPELIDISEAKKVFKPKFLPAYEIHNDEDLQRMIADIEERTERNKKLYAEMEGKPTITVEDIIIAGQEERKKTIESLAKANNITTEEAEKLYELHKSIKPLFTPRFSDLLKNQMKFDEPE